MDGDRPGLRHDAGLLFKQMLLAAGVPEARVGMYSMHSWRPWLACALLAAALSTARAS